ncbi:MAG TPA: hypothetical protein PKK06_04035 [Phycisphaerae bacterium]|nr:hypothetical protein [Phycisphaerae bacterium]HNU44888.1 hypothetical protein [Phycisphaerae bacterium]
MHAWPQTIRSVWVVAALTALLSLASVARAQTPASPPPPVTPPTETVLTPSPDTAAVLQTIPADADGVLIIPKLAECDARLTALAQRAAFPPISALTLAKGWLEIITGIDETGAAAVVLLPARTPQRPAPSLLLIIPTADRHAVLGLLNAEPLEAGYFRVRVRGRESFAAACGPFTVLGPSVAAVQAIVEPTGEPLAARLQAAQKGFLTAGDIVFWLDLTRLPGGIEAGRSAESPWPWPLPDAAVLAAHRQALATLRIEPQGVTAELHLGPAASAAQPAGGSSTSERTLLEGLPAGPCAVALGATGQSATAMARLLLGNLVPGSVTNAPVDAAALQGLRETCLSLAENVSALSLSVAQPADPTEGLLAAYVVLDMRGGSGAVLATLAAAIERFRASVGAEQPAQRVGRALVYQQAAERRDELAVDHLTFDLGVLPPEQTELWRKVLGNEGLLIRLAAIGETRLLVGLGGGPARFAVAAAAAQSEQAPLAAEAGLVRAATRLPAQRSFAAYVYLERVRRLFTQLAATAGAPERTRRLPIVADIDAPIGVVANVEEGGTVRVNAFIPVELIAAIRAAVVENLARDARISLPRP